MLLSERNKAQRAKWELFKSNSLVETVHKAQEMGWAEKKVQVRGVQTGPERYEYSIEPFEKDCGCSNILKYEDYKREEETLLMSAG